MKPYFRYPFLLLISQFFLFCSHKHPAVAEYFERYFQYQESISREIPEDEIRSIIYGNPESDAEEYLHSKDGSYFLSLRLTGSGTQFKKELSGVPFPATMQSPYTVFVEAKRSEFRTKNTYKVKRRIEMISPEVSVFDVFPIIEESISHLRKIDSSQIEKDSELQKFLCLNWDCSLKKEDGVLFFSYALSDRMKENFPRSYKKLSKRLDQTAFRFQLFQSHGFSKGIELYNEGRKIVLAIPPSPPGYWSHPKTLHLRSYFFLSILGLKIDIRGLGYTFHFSKSGKTDIVTGEFTKIPEANIGGRFLSVFPIGMVNMFVPENMDQYAEDSFELLVKGSDGKGGNSFQTRTTRNGNKTKVVLTSDSEIFRDRFLPFKSKDKDDEPDFFSELGKALVSDLRGK